MMWSAIRFAQQQLLLELVEDWTSVWRRTFTSESVSVSLFLTAWFVCLVYDDEFSVRILSFKLTETTEGQYMWFLEFALIPWILRTFLSHPVGAAVSVSWFLDPSGSFVFLQQKAFPAALRDWTVSWKVKLSIRRHSSMMNCSVLD